MQVDSFLDTNVLVYAVVSDPDESAKRETALALIEREDFALSAQVLQEFFVTVTRKLSVPLSALQAMEWIEPWEAFPCVDIDAALVKIAVEISERYRISYRDGAVITAAPAGRRCGRVQRRSQRWPGSRLGPGDQSFHRRHSGAGAGLTMKNCFKRYFG